MFSLCYIVSQFKLTRIYMAGKLDYRSKLLDLYEVFPFERHPLWQGVMSHVLTFDQLMLAETQHYLRTKAGQKLRQTALLQAKSQDEKVFELLLETYIEECTSNEKSGPSHLTLIKRLLTDGGVSEQTLERARNTPGNAAAISLYKSIGERGFDCHMLGAGTVEFFYSKLCPKIFKAYTEHYGMSKEQAHTYELHGPMDLEHAERAFQILPDAINRHGWEVIEMSVRDAFVATSLHYDGMLQAATNSNQYWDGRS